MRIFLLSAILPLLLSGISCSESYTVVDEKRRERGADIRIYNFERQSLTVVGTLKWHMKAEEAYIFQEGQQQKRISIYKFEFIDYTTEGKPQSRITADRGAIDHDTGKFILEGDVVYLSLDGEREIRSEKMEYSLEEKMLDSTIPVIIRQGDITTTCRGGMVIYTELNRQICRSPVGLREKIQKPKPVPGKVPENSREGDPDIFQ